MRQYRSDQLDDSQLDALCTRTWTRDPSLTATVEEVCREVKTRGDEALREYGRRFDRISVEALAVTAGEIEAACSQVPAGLIPLIERAARNIRAFHASQRTGESRIETEAGIQVWREYRPIEVVGLYVPAGTAPLPSTVLMLGIPAVLAGCGRILICSPPKADGGVDPAVLAAASIVGISEIYKVGGAQAIAAMAYGTQSISKVDKIFGPGNRFVTEAKRQVASDPSGAAIDMLAGPSELLVIADEAADPGIVAADLLSQAEHDGQSQVALVTPCEALAGRVHDEVARQLARLPRNATAARALENSYLLIVPSIEEAVAFSNRYAPEHLIINTSDAEGLVPLIRHAGSVFLGPHAPVTAGDYASGTNHTLPTGGTARWSGGITIESYLKSMTFQSLTRQGLDRLAPALVGLARIEGLEAHARAVLVRQAVLPPAPGTMDAGVAAQASAPGRPEDSAVRQSGRSAHVERKTSETSVLVDVVLDGAGVYRIQTGIGFLDHMLALLSRHSLIDLRVEVTGDLQVDEHHSVEDVGLMIGEAIRKALGDKRGIERYGFLLPMDESLAQVALDLGGRPFFSFAGDFQREKVGEFPTELVEDFFRAFADGLRANLHIGVTGRNDHHKIEAIFKAIARSLKQAVSVDERAAFLLPTTKGTL